MPAKEVILYARVSSEHQQGNLGRQIEDHKHAYPGHSNLYQAKRIRLYPSTEEKEKLQRWVGTARWTYNECLRAIQNENVPRTKKALRERALNEEAIVTMNKTWLCNTPYDIHDAAMDDLLKAYVSGFARKKNDNKAFKLHFRSRKHSFQESIVIHHKHFKKKMGIYSFLKKIQSAEPLPEELGYDSRLVLE